MLYAIIAQDVEDSLPLRKANRPAHLARLEQFAADGRVSIAGAHPTVDGSAGELGVTGSLIVAEFASLEEAQEWANQDPYTLNGVYDTVTVKPFLQVFPKS